MKSSRTITLFTESQELSQGPASVVASIVFHCMAIGLVFFCVLYSPRLDTRAIAHRYNVRRLDLDMPEDRVPRPALGKVKYPSPNPVKAPDASAGKPAVLRQMVHAPKGPQTLLQPDLDKQIALNDVVPLPTLMVWSPSKNVVKTIVAPQPAKPTASNVTPSPAAPIQEVNLADVNIATSELQHPKLPVTASTTSPVAVQAPVEVQLPPTTISQVSAQPTPAAVMSLSDVHLAQGTVVLPPVNESASANSAGNLAPGEANSKAPGNTDHDGNGGSSERAGSGAGTPGNAAADAGSDSNGRTTATKITLPRDGQFGSVVVGASLQDEFPEMNRVWGGRLAYTVYLHVGLARSWILQYSLPMNEDVSAVSSVARLDAPWPFNIVRPNLGGETADEEAIMVHGYVNQSGRFEGLRIVFPPEYSQTQFVLASLQQWQFRPAARDGQLARVEVLLIIPEELR